MAKNTTANEIVDFNNPEALAAELEAAGTQVAATKEKKEPKPRVIKVSYVADKDYAAGDTIEFDYEVPKSAGIRGQLLGLTLEEMTNDQLKIEFRNANSVHYKTKKAGGDATRAAARLEAVKAVMAAKGIQPTGRAATPITAAVVAELIKDGKISVEALQALLNGEDVPAGDVDTSL